MPRKQSVNSMVGILICGWAAASASIIFWDHTSLLAIPPWLLLVAAATVAGCYGFKSGFFGTLFAVLIFFIFLVLPLDAASYRASRFNLLCMIAGGTAISYVLSGSLRRREQDHVGQRRQDDSDRVAEQVKDIATVHIHLREEKHEIESV
jgi:uncharacterized membrane protein YccC